LLSFRFRHDQALAAREMTFIEGLSLQASLAVQMSRLAEEQQSAAQVAAVLDERNRIAREIHDTLAQTLTGVFVQAEAASRALPDTGAIGAHLERISTLAREGLQEARQSVRALRPALLDGSTLALALAALCDKQSGQDKTGTRFEFAVKGTPHPLPPEVEDALLRVTQESLVNVERHACARTAWVELRFDPEDVDSMECVCVRVQDDGRGFDTNALDATGGFGLVGMCERMEILGGTFDISSRPGQGTEVRAGIALPP
jgi:two-component system NarL family sensor kinase